MYKLLPILLFAVSFSLADQDEEIVSNVIKDIFGEDLNKSSIKATVSEIKKGYKN